MSTVEAPAICPVLPARGHVTLGNALIHPVPNESPLQPTVTSENLAGGAREAASAAFRTGGGGTGGTGRDGGGGGDGKGGEHMGGVSTEGGSAGRAGGRRKGERGEVRVGGIVPRLKAIERRQRVSLSDKHG